MLNFENDTFLFDTKLLILTITCLPKIQSMFIFTTKNLVYTTLFSN